MFSEATTTADGTIAHDKTMEAFQSRSALDVSTELRKRHCEAEGWSYPGPLRVGSYGLDALLYTINHVNAFLLFSRSREVADVSYVIHQAWCDNYAFWKSQEPWKRTDVRFFPPANGFTDRHQYCFDTPFEKLDEEEKRKDMTLARILLDMARGSPV